MKIKFWKYQGTGNDFVILDGREDVSLIKDNKQIINRLCDRKFGIGADGLIIIEEDVETDFRMIYYNADGGPTSMCGNGGRCSIAFAKFKGFSGDLTEFMAIDGHHDGEVKQGGWVDLGMIDVTHIEERSDKVFVLNTGSPHYVYFLDKDEEVDIVSFGKAIRYNEEFADEGINVNTVKVHDDYIQVETYERGVEDETLSCGTGVTACAIAYQEKFANGVTEVKILTKGGDLKVGFRKENEIYTNVVLSGPVSQVFTGEIEL